MDAIEALAVELLEAALQVGDDTRALGDETAAQAAIIASTHRLVRASIELSERLHPKAQQVRRA